MIKREDLRAGQWWYAPGNDPHNDIFIIEIHDDCVRSKFRSGGSPDGYRDKVQYLLNDWLNCLHYLPSKSDSFRILYNKLLG